MRKLFIYTDVSVIGGCEDIEFSEDSKILWQRFLRGDDILVLSAHTLRELEGAPEAVRKNVEIIPKEHVIMVLDNDEAFDLAQAYVKHGVVGPGSHSDALHVALATIAKVDVIVSWNFKHIVNLNRIHLYNAVNIEMGYGPIEIRTPKEVALND